ncbi:MAG: hypothetical protein Q7S99_03655 [Parvibaculum sp.]|nr:hypothetical protein [Parvibaculum sp.]|tara:strand:- start:100 stop:339 length:240 start_codon:yes stop_codon:yes gene_type:complete
MIRSNNWDISFASTVGAFLGATYTLIMCGISNLLSVPSMSIVLIAIVIGATFGAGILGGIAVLLNYVRSLGTPDIKQAA